MGTAPRRAAGTSPTSAMRRSRWRSATTFRPNSRASPINRPSRAIVRKQARSFTTPMINPRPSARARRRPNMPLLTPRPLSQTQDLHTTSHRRHRFRSSWPARRAWTEAGPSRNSRDQMQRTYTNSRPVKTNNRRNSILILTRASSLARHLRWRAPPIQQHTHLLRMLPPQLRNNKQPT